MSSKDEYILRRIRTATILWEGSEEECEAILTERINEQWTEETGVQDYDYEEFFNNHRDLYVIETKKDYFTYIVRNS